MDQPPGVSHRAEAGLEYAHTSYVLPCASGKEMTCCDMRDKKKMKRKKEIGEKSSCCDMGETR